MATHLYGSYSVGFATVCTSLGLGHQADHLLSAPSLLHKLGVGSACIGLTIMWSAAFYLFVAVESSRSESIWAFATSALFSMIATETGLSLSSTQNDTIQNHFGTVQFALWSMYAGLITGFYMSKTSTAGYINRYADRIHIYRSRRLLIVPGCFCIFWTVKSLVHLRAGYFTDILSTRGLIYFLNIAGWMLGFSYIFSVIEWRDTRAAYAGVMAGATALIVLLPFHIPKNQAKEHYLNVIHYTLMAYICGGVFVLYSAGR